jgi:RHS repeat-associated protein
MDSVTVVLDDGGKIVTQHEYLPFGETWTHEGDAKHNPKYNSQELDRETGYYFYNARYYDPEIARFVTPDNVIDGEMDTQGWNRYSYVKNNPIVYKDPTGHAGESRYDSFVEKYQSGEYKTQSVEMKKGDTIWGIAQKTGVDTELLLQMNNVKDPKKLQIGTKINVPLDRRPLMNTEIAETKKVFGNSIDYDKVEVAKGTKWSNAFGLPEVGPIRKSTMVTGNTINVRESDMEKGTLKFKNKNDLIHELTHVLQYQRSGYGYMADSAINQTLKGDKAYNYQDSMKNKVPWKKLEAEQQAQLVEDYYKERYMYKSDKKDWNQYTPYINDMRNSK